MPVIIEKQFSNEINFIERQNSIQLEPSLMSDISFNNQLWQNAQTPSTDNHSLEPQLSIQPQLPELSTNQSYTLPASCFKPEFCDDLIIQPQFENTIPQTEQILQQPEQSQLNQSLQTQSAPPVINQNTQNFDNKTQPLVKSDSINPIPTLDLKMQDSYKLNEEQKNMLDYAFLNDQEGLDRLYIRTRSSKEYKNIIKATNNKMKQLTLNHDGHHFKLRNDFQRRPRQINNSHPTEFQFKLPNNRKMSSIVKENPQQLQNQNINKNLNIQNPYSFNSKQVQQGNQQLNDKYPFFNPQQQQQYTGMPQQRDLSPQSQQVQLQLKIGDQFLVSSANCQDFSQSSNFNYSQDYSQNQYNQQRKNQIYDDSHFEENDRALKNDEDSFEKSSNNLTSEQWQCIQQLQKHKKKNVAKNIMTAFKNFISNPMKFGYSQQQICTALSCYNRSKKIDESFDEMQNKFMKYIVKKKFNHYTIKLLIQHPNYGEVFEYFLKYLSDFWLEQSKVHDIEAHLAMIKFLKEAYNDIEIINQLKKYDKRKY